MDTGRGSAGALIFLRPFPGSTIADRSGRCRAVCAKGGALEPDTLTCLGGGGRLASLLANAGFRQGPLRAEQLGVWANQTRRFITGN